MGRQWIQVGKVHVWRTPFVADGKWCVRLRRKGGGKVFWRTLKAEVLKIKGRGLAVAMQEVSRLAAEEGPADPTPPDARRGEKTVKEALLLWLAEQQGEVAIATFCDYSADIEQVIAALGPAVPILDISKDKIREVFKARWGGLGSRSKQKAAGLLRRVFSWLVVEDIIPSSPAVVLAPRTRWRKEIQAARVDRHQNLTVEEGRRLIDAAREPLILKYRGGSKSDPIPPEKWPLIWLMISMKVGLRPGDSIGSPKYSKEGLKWKSVNLKDGTIEIAWDQTKGGRNLKLPLADDVWETLQEYHAEVKPSPEDRVIPGEVKETRKTLARLLRLAKLVDDKGRFIGEQANRLTPHALTQYSFRHSFGAWIDRYVGNKAVKRILLGHASVDVTDVYGAGGLPEDFLRESVNKIPRISGSADFVLGATKGAV